MAFFDFPTPMVTPEAEALRAEIRAFLASGVGQRWVGAKGDGWNSFDPDFSRELGKRGWIGMTWPKSYGGHERSALERYVVSEELLAAGAPVGAH